MRHAALLFLLPALACARVSAPTVARVALNTTPVRGPKLERPPSRRNAGHRIATVALSEGHVLVRNGVSLEGVWLLDRVEAPSPRVLGFDDISGIAYLFDDRGEVLASREVSEAAFERCDASGHFVDDGTAVVFASYCEDGRSGPYRWDFATDLVREAPADVIGERPPEAGVWGSPHARPGEEASQGLAPFDAGAPRNRITFHRPEWSIRVGERLFIATWDSIFEIVRGRAERTRCQSVRAGLVVANAHGVRVLSPYDVCDLDRGTLVEGSIMGTSEDGRFLFIENGDRVLAPERVTYELVDLVDDRAVTLGTLDLPAMESPFDVHGLEGHDVFVGASGRYVAVVPDGSLFGERDVVILDVRTRRIERFDLPVQPEEGGALPRCVRRYDDVFVEREPGKQVRIHLADGTHTIVPTSSRPRPMPTLEHRGDARPVIVEGLEVALEDGAWISLVEDELHVGVVERRGRVYSLAETYALAERPAGMPGEVPSELHAPR